MQIVPLSDTHVAATAGIAALRYREARAAMSLMPAEFADPLTFEERLADAAKKHHGLVAISEEHGPVAYMTGFEIDAFQGSARGVYIPEWAHGVDPVLPVKDAEDIYRTLYAEILSKWVEHGCLSIAISIYPSDSRLRELLFWGGFGLIVCDAMRDVQTPEAGSTPPPPSLGIVPADLDRLDDIMTLSDRLQHHLSASPIYLYPDEVEDRPAMETWLSVPGHYLWLAYLDDTPVGFIRCEPPTHTTSFITASPGTIGITGMYVLPAYRSRGVGTALLSAVTSYAKSAGLQRISVDFETRNITARKFWLRHFQPISFSLMRRLDDRFVSIAAPTVNGLST